MHTRILFFFTFVLSILTFHNLHSLAGVNSLSRKQKNALTSSYKTVPRLLELQRMNISKQNRNHKAKYYPQVIDQSFLKILSERTENLSCATEEHNLLISNLSAYAKKYVAPAVLRCTEKVLFKTIISFGSTLAHEYGHGIANLLIEKKRMPFHVFIGDSDTLLNLDPEFRKQRIYERPFGFSILSWSQKTKGVLCTFKEGAIHPIMLLAGPMCGAAFSLAASYYLQNKGERAVPLSYSLIEDILRLFIPLKNPVINYLFDSCSRSSIDSFAKQELIENVFCLIPQKSKALPAGATDGAKILDYYGVSQEKQKMITLRAIQAIVCACTIDFTYRALGTVLSTTNKALPHVVSKQETVDEQTDSNKKTPECNRFTSNTYPVHAK